MCLLLAAMLAMGLGCNFPGVNGVNNGDHGDGAAGGDNGGSAKAPEPAAHNLVKVENTAGDGYFYRLEELPETVQHWVDNAAKNIFLGQSRVFGEHLYILVTYGPQPTGGYAVDITDVHVGSDAVEVLVEFSAPGPDDVVTQGFTYPYDLALIPAVELPVVFSASGAEEYLMTLYGVDYLEPVIASSSHWIKLFAPDIDDTVAGTLRFRGVASVFEGTVSYRLTGENGRVLTEGYTMAGMGDWYYFEESITLSELIDKSTLAMLELYTVSPKDGSEQDTVSVPLRLSP